MLKQQYAAAHAPGAGQQQPQQGALQGAVGPS